MIRHLLITAFLLMCFNLSARPVLSVGTAGDYRPLTWFNTTDQGYEGEAIALVQQFAEDMGYTLVFKATSWPDLTQDLLAGKFQMAVGGISLTEERARLFLTSDPVRRFGKVALVRCEDADKYTSLKAIDKRGVRVVENRGGTNEKFALKHLKFATLTIVPDNYLPFTYLKAHQADVMFTDSMEAVHVQKQRQGLCAVKPDSPYTQGEKVFLFHRDQPQLQARFNAWLRRQ